MVFVWNVADHRNLWRLPEALYRRYCSRKKQEEVLRQGIRVTLLGWTRSNPVSILICADNTYVRWCLCLWISHTCWIFCRYPKVFCSDVVGRRVGWILILLLRPFTVQMEGEIIDYDGLRRWTSSWEWRGMRVEQGWVLKCSQLTWGERSQFKCFRGLRKEGNFQGTFDSVYLPVSLWKDAGVRFLMTVLVPWPDVIYCFIIREVKSFLCMYA